MATIATCKGKDMSSNRSHGTPFQMDTSEVMRFSIDNALRYLVDPATYGEKVGLENEIAHRALKSGGATQEGGVFIPWSVLARDVRKMGLAPQRRDLVAGTPTAGGHLVGTDVVASGFVEALYPLTAVLSAGATTMTDLVGNTAVPRMIGGSTVYWVAESGAPTESQAAFDQVPLTPKTVGAYMDVSRRLLLQSSVDVLATIKRDMLSQIAVAVDEQAIIGTGTDNKPRGVLNTTGIGAIVGGANGAEPTLQHLIDLENYSQSAGYERGVGAFITSPKVRGKLQRTQRFSSTNGEALWQAVGKVDYCNGRPAYATTLVPDNLTKGSSTGVCSAILYGVWDELVIGVWGGGVTILVDPYTGSTAGTVRLVALLDMDIAIRNPVAFAVMTDVLTSDS